ncbi:probable palmitoyltransferase ZDHHC24 isoform X1 [Lagenorhynchus albirostris]|uniref:probable palmitoyltransferase ZDHHC24 isoform X1 n=1 Tax=Lagenorhynchus albirostris TaxID=27610 RepID=UPI0028ED58FD|nr:probable palmitoyltransferase ZDHHC24 isoform X1 [Lagenorhynchus albirostris]
MGQPRAVGSAEAASARLPLVLTALWAAAVGLELAYVLVLGPGPPPLGPLARTLQLALATFQLLNLLGNVGLFLRSDPSIRGVMLAGRGLGQGWAYCYQCQSQVPPRSGHCSACRICILRRDHHCRLLGRCVGFHNYRPFLCLLLHAAGVLLHVSVLLVPALLALLRAHTPLHTAALLLLPWLMLLTGGGPGRPPQRGRGPFWQSVSGAVRAGLRDRHVCGGCTVVRGWTALPWDVAAEGPDHVGVGSGPALLRPGPLPQPAGGPGAPLGPCLALALPGLPVAGGRHHVPDHS